MTEKEQKIQEARKLFFDTKDKVTKNPENWQEFLKTGSRTYKYPLRDQILIHAQNPNVTACASFEVWTETLKRNIKRGSKGIALLHNDKNGGMRLDYVHDIANTQEKTNSKTGFLWEMKQDYQEAIQQSMTARFGEVGSNNFESMLMEWSEKSVQEHIPDIVDKLMNEVEGSFLEGLDQQNVEVSLRRAVTSSVQFSVLTRCGFDPTQQLENEDFKDIFDFNTNNVFGILGNAITDVNCDLLNQIGDIARSVEKGEYQKNLEKKLTKTENDLDNQKEVVYDIVEGLEPKIDITNGKEDKAHERDSNNDLDGGGSIHSRLRTGTSALGNRGGGERTSGNVGRSTSEIPEKPQEAPVSSHGFQHDLDGTRLGDRQTGRRDGGVADGTNDDSRGSDGGSQASRPSPVGEIVQQRDGESEGNRLQRTDLRLNETEIKENSQVFEQTSIFDTVNPEQIDIQSTGAEEQVSSAPVSISTEKRNTTYEDFENVLAHGTGEAGSKERIAEFFANPEHSKSEKADFLKNEYGTSEISVENYQVRTKEHYGMALEIPDETQQKILPFHKLVDLIDGMMERGEYLKAEERPQPEPIPTVEKPEERTSILYSEASQIGKNKVESGMEEDYEIPLFHGNEGKEFALDFGLFGNGTTVWNYLENEDDDYKIVAHISENHVLTVLDDDLPKEARDFLLEKAEIFYPTVVEQAEIKLEEEIQERIPPDLLFFEDFDQLSIDFSQYQDGDLIGYDINGVKFELGEMDGQYFTTTTTAIAPDGQVLGTSMSQENYEKFKAWKEELTQGTEKVPEVTPKAEDSVEIPENIEKSRNTILWEKYQELQNENPSDLVMIQNGGFFEVQGEKVSQLPTDLDVTPLFRECNGEQVAFFGFPHHILEDYQAYLNEVGFDLTVATVNSKQEYTVERFENTAPEQTVEEVQPEITSIEKSPETLFWEQYKELQAENPTDLVLYQNKAFYEIMGENTAKLPEELHDKIFHRVCDGEEVPVFSFIEHQILDYVEYFHEEGFSITEVDVKANGEKFTQRFPSDKDIYGDNKENQVSDRIAEILSINEGAMNPLSPTSNPLEIEYYAREPKGSFSVNPIFQQFTNEELKTALETMGVEIELPVDINADFPYKTGDIVSIDSSDYQISMILEDSVRYTTPSFGSGYLEDDKATFLAKVEEMTEKSQVVAEKEVPPTLEKGLEFSMDGTEYIVDSVSDLTGTVYLQDKNSSMNSLEMADKSEILEHLQKEERVELPVVSQEPAKMEIQSNIPDFPHNVGDVLEIDYEIEAEILSISDTTINWKYVTDFPNVVRENSKDSFLQILEKYYDKNQTEVALTPHFQPEIYSHRYLEPYFILDTQHKKSKYHGFERYFHENDKPVHFATLEEAQRYCDNLNGLTESLEDKLEVSVSERIPVGLEVTIDDSNLIVEKVDEKEGYVYFQDEDMVKIGMGNVLGTRIEIERVLDHLQTMEQEEMAQIQEQPTAESSSPPPIPTIPEPEIPDFPFKNGDFVDLGENLKYSVLAVNQNDVLLRNNQVMMGDNTLTLSKEKLLELVDKQQAKEELAKTPVEPVNTEKSTSEALYEAFQSSVESDWQENSQKQRKIQGAFYKILDDETQTKDLFALVQEIEPSNQFEFDRIYQVITTNQEKELTNEKASMDFAVGDVVELGGTNYKVRKIDGDDVQLNNSISRPPLTFTKEELQDKLQEQGDLQARKERNLQDLEEIPVENVAEFQPKEQVAPTTAEPTSQSAPRTDITEKKGENFKITNPELGHGTAKEKCHRNILAIQTLQQIEGEKRSATPEEQEILSNYVGWGGLQEAFDENKSAWASEFATLKDLLPEKDYAAAKRTVLDSFYTAPEIIESMYEALEKMGVPKDVQILEPSLGVGNFIGMKPEYFSEATVSGSELDSISGRIAKQLYPEAEIQVKGFEKTDFYDESFDVAIGNVPFGDFHVHDPKYNDQKLQVHDYFFAKSLDQVKDGGIVAFITSSGTMDKKNSAFREKMSEQADLLGAIRLPNTAFKKNAGTEVTSDIIFLQKRSEPPEKTPDWVKTGENKEGIPMNQYFVNNPEMIMGNIEMQPSRFGPAPVCVPDTKTTLKEQLTKAIDKLKKPVMELLEKLALVKNTEEKENKGERIFGMEVPETARNFSFFLKDDTIYYKENDKIFKPEVKKAHAPRIKGMIALVDQTREVIRLQQENCSDQELEKAQAVLNKLHDSYHKNHKEFAWTGNKSAFKKDVSFPLLCSLQNLDDDKKLVSKADIFSKRTIRQTEKITAVDTPVEALGVCIGEKAKVDIPFMEQLLQGKMDSKEIIASLEGIIFKNPLSDMSDPLDGWENADEYLSGNVREKLEVAELKLASHPELEINVEHLKAVLPTPLKATEIDVRIGSTWIDPKYYEQFMYEMFGTPTNLRSDIKIELDKHSNEWNITGKSMHKDGAMHSKFGTKRKSPYKLLEDSLNLRDTNVSDSIDGEYVKNPVETAKARDKQDVISTAFRKWIFEEPTRREHLEEKYNIIYNSIRPREFDGSHIQFEGMTDQIELKPHQKNAVARTLYGENTLLAHCVGAGKSYTMIASAMEGKRLGVHKKSMIVVPKHLIVQMGADVSKLYPSAKVLVATEDDFNKDKRQEFCSRIATGNFDVVVMGHTQFTSLEFSPERAEKILNRQIDDFTAALTEAKGENGSKFTVKKLEKAKENAKTKLEKLKAEPKPEDSAIFFDDLGVDKLFVDEAHYFKNLITPTKMQNVAGVSNGDSSRALDMLGKCQYIDEVSGGKGIVFATGTPISNSICELYVMMKFLQENTLKKMDLHHFDSWASSFGEKVTSLEVLPEGVRYKGGQELV